MNEIYINLLKAERGMYAFNTFDLTYSQTKCMCGAQFAYPKGIGISGKWCCSDILKNVAPLAGEPGAVEHNMHVAFQKHMRLNTRAVFGDDYIELDIKEQYQDGVYHEV